MNSEMENILNHSLGILSGKEIHSFTKKLGPHYSERCIETPWVASLIQKYDIKKILDIGFTMASLDYLGLLLEIMRNKIYIEAVDIVKPDRVKNRYPKEWFEDIMKVPINIGDINKEIEFKTEFDAVTCISTIEHVGFDSASKDNLKTAFNRNNNAQDVITTRNYNTSRNVLNNLAKVLKKNGKLIISVPAGKGGPIVIKDSLGYYCCYWEYEKESWSEIIKHDLYNLISEYYFDLKDDGYWTQVSSISELKYHDAPDKTQAQGLALAILEKK